LLIDDPGRRSNSSNLTPYGSVGRAALRGREPSDLLIDESPPGCDAGEVKERPVGVDGRSAPYNGLGRYDEAREARFGSRVSDDLSTSTGMAS